MIFQEDLDPFLEPVPLVAPAVEVSAAVRPAPAVRPAAARASARFKVIPPPGRGCTPTEFGLLAPLMFPAGWL